MLNSILSYIKCILDFSIFWWFFSFFFIKRYSGIWNILALCILSALLQYINTLYIPWLNTVSGLILGLCLGLILFTGKIPQKCICAFLAVIALLVCEFIPIAISTFLVNDNIAIVMNKTICDAAFNFIGTALFFCIVLLIRYYTQKKHAEISTNYFTICVPILSVLVIYFMLNASRYVPSSFRINITYISLYIAIILTNILLVFGERNVEKKFALEKELSDLRYKENITDALIQQQAYYIEEMNGIRHDFKRQLLGLYSMSKALPVNDLPAEYIKEVMESVDGIQSFDYIESLPLRVIISSTYSKCIRNGIDFITDIRYSKFDFMTFPDIFSFFDNALENAFEACTAITDPSIKKYISISITNKEDMLFIQVCNPYCRDTIPSEHGFFSTKGHDGRYHGYGTKNIWKVANKYHGVLSYDTNGKYKMTCIFTNIISKNIA